jgi:hypothetical protein
MWLLLIYVGYRVYIKVEFTNKVILGMVLFLILGSMAKAALYSCNSFIYHNLKKDIDYDTHEHIPNPIFTILPLSPVAFLSIAAILNLNNWTFYYFKIGEMASHVDKKAWKYGD